MPIPTVPIHSRFEVSFTLPGAPAKNPFDFRETDVVARVETPAGVVRVPAFYDGPAKDGSPLWRVRVTPTIPGAHTLTITRNRRAIPAPRIVSGVLTFRAVASRLPGFVTRDPAHRQRFLRAGRPLYPLGLNQAWRSDRDPPYPETFAKMKKAGCDWARLWCDHFYESKNLEWSPNKPPLGTYDLVAARRWDTIFEAAAASGVMIQMCLQHHGQYSTRVNPNWNDNPYNIKNGGFLTRPEDFFTDPHAIALTEQKYRYMAARWGYAPHLFAWELFNEVQFTDRTPERWQVVGGWHARMAAFLRRHDPNRHLITTSSDDDEKNPIFAACDYTQDHRYTDDIEATLRSLRAAGRRKAFFVGEWGASGDGRSAEILRRGLWTGLMTDHAAAPMWWAWDFVDPAGPTDRYAAFARAAAFIRAARLSERTETRQVSVAILGGDRTANLVLGPPGGWGKHTRARFVIPADGSAPDLTGLSSFFQGNNKRDMMPDAPEFDVDFPSSGGGGTATIHLGQIARLGARIEVFVDGRQVLAETFPATTSDTTASRPFTVPIPAGRHTLRIASTGPDWFVVRQIALSPYAPTLTATARAGGGFAALYVQQRRSGTSSGKTGDVRLRVPGITPGRYAVTWWDIDRQRPLLSRAVVLADKQGLTLLAPPSFSQDVAVFAERQGAS